MKRQAHQPKPVNCLKWIRRCTGIAIIALVVGVQPAAAETARPGRPHILWLTLEDSSAYQFSCYGNRDIKTPTIDSLAETGVRFTNVSSVAPHCSVSRSTLICGSWATTYGMDYHSMSVATPEDIFFPTRLRDADYYCTNNRKNDFNTSAKSIGTLWNVRGDSATYSDPRRGAEQPFFSMFNFGPTHMSRFRSFDLAGRRDLRSLGIDPAKIFLPPHVPDNAESRSDQALMLERSLEADAWLKAILEDLKARKLDDDTIIFFFSDHGGAMPRGKGFPFESGLRAPLIVSVPPEWQARAGTKPGTVDDRVIGFEDFAPTVLELAGIKPPPSMQGKSFLGEGVATRKEFQFSIRTNQAEHYDPCRTATDGRFKYIRAYIPHKPFGLRNFFQWGVPSNLAWDRLALSGKCDRAEWLQPFQPKASEMLFDLQSDPWELENLAASPEHRETLVRFRSAVSRHVRDSGDLGFFPGKLRIKDGGVHSWVRKTNYPLAELHEAAEIAGMPSAADILRLTDWLSSTHAELRYWGAVGLCTLGSRGQLSDCPPLMSVIGDPVEEVACAAADAACYLGREKEGMAKLLEQLAKGSPMAYSSLEAMTWHKSRRPALNGVIPQLEECAGKGGEVAMRARSILINLGRLPVEEINSAEERAAAAKVNLDEPIRDYGPWMRGVSEAAQTQKAKGAKK
jgi:N-sulfoglucosamine sulfohydrolase